MLFCVVCLCLFVVGGGVLGFLFVCLLLFLFFYCECGLLLRIGNGHLAHTNPIILTFLPLFASKTMVQDITHVGHV